MNILALEAKLIKMLDAGIPISEIVCLSPYPELEGDWETHFGIVHCTYSRFMPKVEALWLIRHQPFRWKPEPIKLKAQQTREES